MLLRKKVIEGLGWNFTISQILFVLQFLSGVVLARVLIPSDFGKIAYLTATVTLIFILRGLGFDNYLVQCDKDKLAEYGGTAIFFNALLCVFICLSSITLARFTMEAETFSMFTILMVSRTLQHVFFSYQNIVAKELLYKKMALLTFIPEVLSMGTGLYLVLSGWGIWSLVWMAVVNIGAVVILSVFFSPYSVKPHFSKRALKDLWNYGKYNILTAVTGKSSSNLDNIIVQNLSGSQALGFYNKGYGLSKIFNQFIGNVVLRVIGPLFSRYKNDKRKLSLIYNKSVSALFRLNLGIYLIFICVADDLIEFVYTQKWVPAVPILRILILFALLNPIIGMSRRFFLNTGKTKPVGISQMILFLVLLITIFPLVARYGIMGAAVSVDMAFSTCFIFLIYYIKQHIEINLIEIFLAPALTAALVFSFYFFLSDNLLIEDIAFRLAVHATFLAVLYFGILFLVERKYYFRSIKALEFA